MREKLALMQIYQDEKDTPQVSKAVLKQKQGELPENLNSVVQGLCSFVEDNSTKIQQQQSEIETKVKNNFEMSKELKAHREKLQLA